MNTVSDKGYGSIGQRINLDSGIGSKRSDSTIIFSVSCHSNVTTFAPRCTPRIFNNPIIISVIGSITNNDHRMIHLKVSTRQVPVVRTSISVPQSLVHSSWNYSYVSTFWLIIYSRLIQLEADMRCVDRNSDWTVLCYRILWKMNDRNMN